jgi:hypothetical protein
MIVFAVVPPKVFTPHVLGRSGRSPFDPATRHVAPPLQGTLVIH